MLLKKANVHFILIALFALVCILCLSCNSRVRDKKSIQQTWENYTAAVANNLGSESIKYIDTATMNYYSNMLDIIKTADSFTTSRLRFDQKILVLSIRYTTPKNKLSGMNGKSFFEYCVQSGMCSANGKSTAYLELLYIKGERALGQLLDSNNHPVLKVYFNREDGQWKVNLTSVLAELNGNNWKMIIKETGRTEEDLIEFILKDLPQANPMTSIWNPITVFYRGKNASLFFA